MDNEIKPEVREDLWWITDETLTCAMRIVARQFIEEDMVVFNLEQFRERSEYILRQHCPIVYGYFFDQVKVTTLPLGSLQIILDFVQAERPLFLPGVGRHNGSDS